jgi:O-antigen ligase
VAVIVLARLRKFLTLMVPASLVLILSLLYYQDDFTQVFAHALDRQKTIGSAYEADGLAGRVEIWNDRIGMLNENPILWFIGTGFGSAIETGDNGHMLYLHITVECGIIGLAVFLFLVRNVAGTLWRRERGVKFFWCATLALLVSGLTQETFYPVPALSQFCGLYLFCLAVVLRLPVSDTYVKSKPVLMPLSASQCSHA